MSLVLTAGSAEHHWSWGSVIIAGWTWGAVGLVCSMSPKKKCGKAQIFSACSALSINSLSISNWKRLFHLFQIISKLYFLSFSHKKDYPGSGQRADTRILSSAGFIDALPVSDPSGRGTSSLISYWPWCYQQCWEGDAQHGTSQEPRPPSHPPWSMTGQQSPAPWVPAGMVGTPGEGWSVPLALPHFYTVEFTSSFHYPLSSLPHLFGVEMEKGILLW